MGIEAGNLALPSGCIRLEPLGEEHIEGLDAAAAEDPSLYQWSVVPQGMQATTAYVRAAVAAREAAIAVPFATIDVATGRVVGSTRFFDFERWAWPSDHPENGVRFADGCEIGYTWLARWAVRTGANTEAKFLMLRHAFEQWRVFRVCLHTDERNERSRRAMERMGASFEGILRAYRLAADFTPRNSARYSILKEEWPSVKQRLEGLLERGKEGANPKMLGEAAV